MDMSVILDYMANQTPIFIIAVLSLLVAGLALGFGICVAYFFSKHQNK